MSLSDLRVHLTLVAFCLTSPFAFAQGQDQARRPYAGQRLVQVVVENEAQLQAVLDEADGLWNHRVGVGPIQVMVDDESLAALGAMGLAPVTIVEDLQAVVDAERAEIERRRLQLDLTWFENYHPYSEIIAYHQQLANDFPQLASVSVIGQSHQSRDIIATEITGPGDASNRPVIFFNGMQHAREWISPAVVTYIADRLCNLYGQDQRVTDLLDRVVVKIVPIVNPDGYSYSWTNERFWRKNRRNNGNGTFGVDLNRNWDINFGGDGSSGDPSSDIYRGPFAFSEPETSAVRDYVLADPNIVAHVDFHSYSQLILYPWGYADIQVPEPDYTFFVTFSQFLSDVIRSVHGVFYIPMQAIDLYPASGTCSDWTYSVDIKGWTIELRPNGNPGFDLPPGEILPTSEENFEAALAIMERFKDAIRLEFPQGEVTTAYDLTPTTIQVQAEEITDTVQSLDLMVQPEVSSSPVVLPMTHLGDGLYEAQIPALACGRSFAYHIEGVSSAGQPLRLPETGQIDASVVSETIVFDDDAETDLGWTVGAPDDTATTGIWNRMNPQGTAAQPEDDHSPAGTDCWVTDGVSGGSLGARDVDGGGTTLTSPQFDASTPSGWLSADAYISYARWYSNDQGADPNNDHMPIMLSNDDGASFVMLEDVTENAHDWVVKTFRIADTITPTDRMRLRIVARDDSPGSIVEACIDDVRVTIQGCRFHPADLNRDATVDASDFFIFLDLFASGSAGADLDLTGVLDANDFFAFLDLFSQA